MAKKAADLIIEVLHRAGVRRIYGIVGDSLNAITEALRERGDIDWIHVRHEEAAAFAAGAEAALTGDLAVCAGSCGPGNTHLLNGLFDCQRTRVPVLAIAAQIPSGEIGRAYFQETRPAELFRACSGYCELVSHPEQLPGVLEIAIRSAIGGRSVSVIVIPGDIALAEYDAPLSAPESVKLALPTAVPPRSSLESLAGLIDAGRRITLFCGRGCEGAHDQLIQLAEHLQAPVVYALGGKEHVEWDNPFEVGLTGLVGFESGRRALMECDTLLMLGTDFPFRMFYPTDVAVAQIDLRPENIGRRAPLKIAVVGDIGVSIDALLPMVERKTDRSHLDSSLANYAKSREELAQAATGMPGQKPISPQFLTRVMSDKAADDAVFTFDVGTVTLWAGRYLRMNGKRRMIGSLSHGSMANALPQAIGAQAAFPGRQVISLSGDGGFTMLMGDFLTLMQQNLPVKVVVYNNGLLGYVAQEMQAEGMPQFGTDLRNPDFAAMARAIGIHAARVDDPGDMEPAVADLLAQRGPALLDVVLSAPSW